MKTRRLTAGTQQRAVVQLVPHRKAWRTQFLNERRSLAQQFGQTLLLVEHIGSTSIPGIPAKPTIDMLVIVRSQHMVRTMKKGLSQLGYSLRPPRPGRKWHVQYLKGPDNQRTFSVHVETTTSKRWRNDLRFRDYLRSHKREAQRYATLKRRLAALYPHDISSYTKGKARFIEDIIQWAKRSR